MCDSAAWLEHGIVKEIGNPGTLIEKYVEDTHTERVVTEGGGSRWGAGGARVERVEVLGSDGEPTLRLHIGEPATFRFHYVTDEPIRKPVLGFGLHRLDGAHATGINTRETVIPERIDGEGHVDFSCERLPLVPGSYDVTVGLFDESNLHTYDFWTKAVRFDVGPGRPREVEGVFAIDGQWTFR
jgi:ABC-2 type transport system ATP-binding protein